MVCKYIMNLHELAIAQRILATAILFTLILTSFGIFPSRFTVWEKRRHHTWYVVHGWLWEGLKKFYDNDPFCRSPTGLLHVGNVRTAWLTGFIPNTAVGHFYCVWMTPMLSSFYNWVCWGHQSGPYVAWAFMGQLFSPVAAFGALWGNKSTFNCRKTPWPLALKQPKSGKLNAKCVWACGSPPIYDREALKLTPIKLFGSKKKAKSLTGASSGMICRWVGRWNPWS